MIKFERPSFKVKSEDKNGNKGKFEISPLERGFGTTLGNSMRRVLLSSVMSGAAVAIKIDTVDHEYQSIEGVVEDVTEIILNIKELVLSIDTDELVELKLDVNKAGVVTAADIKTPLGVKIINEDQVIANVAKGGSLSMEIWAINGRGYVLADENKKHCKSTGAIALDSNFSPITRVSYDVEPTKVGQDANVEKLTLEIETNGAVSAKESISVAARILMGHYELLTELDKLAAEFEVIKEVNEKQEAGLTDMKIEDLDLSVRSYNGLKRAGIITVGEICQKTEASMMNIKNLGKKSLKEIKEKLNDLGLAFK